VRCACVDIGSNTTRLLVAERADGGLREVAARRAFLRLPGDGSPLSDARIAAIAATVVSQVAEARAHGAADVRVVATAAVRAAPNREALCRAVADAGGGPVTILSGADEARLAFLGATGTLAAPAEGPVAVVDVGGGSTEIVIGTAAVGVTWSVSLPGGSGSLTDATGPADPPSVADRERLRRRVAELCSGIRPPRAAVAYAVGGSATSLRRLAGPVLDMGALGRAGDVVCGQPCEALASRYDLHPERARLLPAGLLLLEAASTLLGLPLRVAAGGLREGVILEALGGTRAAGRTESSSSRLHDAPEKDRLN
jgi:exopolyphosphatase / guanosine-5'-triphosphate,3'-diphosphate pyrophosphatase